MNTNTQYLQNTQCVKRPFNLFYHIYLHHGKKILDDEIDLKEKAFAGKAHEYKILVCRMNVETCKNFQSPNRENDQV